MALAALGLSELAPPAPGVPVTDAFVPQLLGVNLVLGLFNLIPAFPMDGGRVLRALLSGSLGRARATTVAARIGRVLAVCFGIAGVYYGYPLHVALAAFIYFAARAEEAHVLFEERRAQYGADGWGVWTAPPGYRWVDRGNGTWQLAPYVVRVPDPERDPSPWR
jgi:hypothetical protein